MTEPQPTDHCRPVPRDRRRLLRGAVTALAVTLVLTALVWPQLPFRSEDTSWYLMLARGDAQAVPDPFAGRLVHTTLAGALASAGLDLEWAFVAVAAVSVWLTLLVVLLLHRRAGLPTTLSVAVVTTWFTADLIRDASLPDASAAAWLAVMLLVLALARRRPAWLLVVIVPALLCRESLALFTAMVALLAWWRGARALAVGVVLVTGAGLLLASHLSDAANVHAMEGPLYIALKFGFNLSRNVLGCELWVPTIEYCDPVRVWTLPAWAPTGAVREMGVCGWNPQRPLWLVIAWTGSFGVVPAWLWARRRAVRAAWPTAPLWLQAALAYGLVALVIAPAAGTVLSRMVGYAWPAFWLAAPILSGLPTRAAGPWRRLVVVHAAAAWLVPLLAEWRPESTPALLAAALLGLGLNVWAARLMTTADRRVGAPGGM